MFLFQKRTEHDDINNEMVSSENDTQTCNHIPTEFFNLDKVIYI